MARGRKKDLSIPPTRALTQQRDYRARKQQYVAALEERCQRAEEENTRLRTEIEVLKAKSGASAVATSCNPEMIKVTSELMQHITSASASLARFQQLIPLETTGDQHSPLTSLPSTTFQFPLTPPAGTPHPSATEIVSGLSNIQTSQPRSADSSSLDSRLDGVQENAWQSNGSVERERSDSPLSQCCGGIMNCHGLIEEDEDPDTPYCSQSLPRTSELRSTSRLDMVGMEVNERENDSSRLRTHY